LRDAAGPGRLQHELPLARGARPRASWPSCSGRPAVLLCADAAAASADLAGGLLACPSCGTGRLARWGHGRERVIRLLGGATARLRPDRARCQSCRRTHIVLPSWCAPRRADAIEVISTGLAAALGGAGCTRIGADLGVPPATVRGWLRRLRFRAEEMRCFAMFQRRDRRHRPGAARPGRLAAA